MKNQIFWPNGPWSNRVIRIRCTKLRERYILRTDNSPVIDQHNQTENLWVYLHTLQLCERVIFTSVVNTSFLTLNRLARRLRSMSLSKQFRRSIDLACLHTCTDWLPCSPLPYVQAQSKFTSYSFAYIIHSLDWVKKPNGSVKRT